MANPMDEEMRALGINVKWYGAVGDGKADDTAAFQAAMAACGKRHRLYIPSGDYRIRQTIENQSRGIVGEAPYVDSGQQGSRILWDPLDTSSDLLPCLRIQDAGVKAVFENFSIFGMVGYNSRNLSTWVDKSLFEQSSYEMFAAGSAAIEVAGGATPIFRNIQTARVKTGLLLNSTKGHVTSYDCSWGGLIGVYCRINSGDYFFQGGGISGAFCGVLLGTILHAGHRGGFPADMHRVHLGFAPYAIYQCIDSGMDDYRQAASVNGLNGIYTTVQFEQCGEAAIKLLSKSNTSSLRMFGFGFSWSVPSYSDDPTRWQYALPDSLMRLEEKQQYAAWFGTLTYPVTIHNDLGALRLSTAPGGKGTAYIEVLTGERESDLTGLNLPQTVIRRKWTPLYRTSDLHERMREREHRTGMPVSAPNLLRNPEVLSNWTVTNGGTISLVSPQQVPVPISNEMKQVLGRNPVILKVTPDGSRSPGVMIDFQAPSLPYEGDAGRNLAMQYFILETSTGSSSLYRSLGRVTAQNWEYIFNDTITWREPGWKHLRGREMSSRTGRLYNFSIAGIPETGDTYIAGVMVNWDQIGSYSPVPHSYMTDSLEIRGPGNGVILTDEATGERYRIAIRNGNVQLIRT
ncbi:hypothetical protein E6C60_3377 [Paenibacillus algicola]|uniref:Rhamnogalacturonase A/B/Epimerase-like pectate lyase domain-containing protein n=1 Tax=Paenibacillus algicola TaxID=2565926 RepID=A0A4P8XND8_9BACL|nr:glycosyl hydrolase family 28-related protein [Paenibacillus algicola]QCT04088.1 hypothetical protein E6C60_3377 [Paenibacillus algicola]